MIRIRQKGEESNIKVKLKPGDLVVRVNLSGAYIVPNGAIKQAALICISQEQTIETSRHYQKASDLEADIRKFPLNYRVIPATEYTLSIEF